MQKLSILTAAAVLALLSGFGLHHAGPSVVYGDDASPARPADTAPNATPDVNKELQRSEAAYELLREAKGRLFSYSSIQADLQEYVALGTRRFEATGRYVAGPFDPLPKLRIEYQVRVGNTQGTLLEVCDGQLLLTQRTITQKTPKSATGAEAAPPRIQVTRRDVNKILQTVYNEGGTPQAILQAELGLGGLPALMASLERSMVFESAERRTVNDRDYHVLQGRWKKEFIAELRKQFRQFGRDPDQYLPEFARIELDAETLFPVRITYWRNTGGENGPAPGLTLEFSNIRLNEPVNPTAFVYIPPQDVDIVDVTDRFVESIQDAVRPAKGPATER